MPGGALDGAGDQHLADIDTVALQPLRKQTDELVLRRIGEREVHEFQAGGVLVHLRSRLTERAICNENGAFLRALQVRERVLRGADQPNDGDVENAPHGGWVGGQEISRLAATV